METIFLIMPWYKKFWNDMCQFLRLPLWFLVSGKNVTHEEFCRMSVTEKAKVTRIDILAVGETGFRITVRK
jgi:hypothetical protein